MLFRMAAGSGDVADPGLPGTLRIRFSGGERPHLFWISAWTQQPEGRCRYKVLSKSRADRSVEVLVLQDGARGLRQPVARLDVPEDSPAGWLDRWVETLADELCTHFERFDLRGIATAEEWREVARRLGWMRDVR